MPSGAIVAAAAVVRRQERRPPCEASQLLHMSQNQRSACEIHNVIADSHAGCGGCRDGGRLVSGPLGLQMDPSLCLLAFGELLLPSCSRSQGFIS